MIGNGSPSLLKSENEYIGRINKFPDQVFMATKDADQEGFEYFRSDDYQKTPNSIDPSLKGRLLFAGFKKIPRMFFIFARNMKTIMGGRNRCYKDLE